jgi:geranylgeranyl reductase family protein
LVDCDILVVGAGPAGTNTARLLAERGKDVLVIEEHPQVGIPVQCAGLVTPRVFDHTPFPIGDLWQNDLRGAIIYAPDGTAVEFETDAVQAQAMDRAGFDQRLADHAASAGAEIRAATKATGMKVHDGHVAVRVRDADGDSTLHARLVVGADGIRGRVAEWADLPAVNEIVSAYEVELAGCHIAPERRHMIPMFAGRAAAPGFFSWIIPVGGDRTRSGLAVAPGLSEAAAKRYYERMFTDPASAPFLAGATEVYRIIGGIPLGLRRRIVSDRVALVGDAAGMAKPTSGGGIYMALVASEHLAPVLDRALATGRAARADLAPYERAVRRTIARELRKGDLLRGLYKRLRDDDLNDLARLLRQPRVRAVIERLGDIDYPSRLVAPLLRREPRFAGVFLRALVRPSPARPERERAEARETP